MLVCVGLGIAATEPVMKNAVVGVNAALNANVIAVVINHGRHRPAVHYVIRISYEAACVSTALISLPLLARFQIKTHEMTVLHPLA